MRRKLMTILGLILIVSVNSFGQNCPCVKTKVIGNDAKADFVHNNNVVAMTDVTINQGETMNLRTDLCVGKAIWYQKGSEKPLSSTHIKPSTTMEYVVKSSLKDCPDIFDTLKITVKNKDLLNNRLGENYTISPNPASNELQISGTGSTFTKIEIRDISGKTLIIEKNLTDLSNYKIDISSLKQGIYILKIYSTNNNIHTSKIIKN